MARTGSKSRTVHKGRGTRSKVVVSVSKQKKNTWTRQVSNTVASRAFHGSIVSQTLLLTLFPFPQEDQRLLEAINDYDTDTKTPWVLIAKKCPGRSSKQCRERWMNHLRPDVKKGNWTEAEDRAIVELQQTLGNRYVHSCRDPTSFVLNMENIQCTTQKQSLNPPVPYLLEDGPQWQRS
jgi:hypothetical protein